MKSDRRRELAHNVLDSELAKGIDFFRRRSNYVVWAVVILLLIVAVALYARNRAQRRQVELQQQLDSLVFSGSDLTDEERVEQLRQLAQQDDNTYVAAMANVQLGHMFLMQLALSSQGRSRIELDNLIEEARSRYQRVLDRYGDQKVPVALARLGLGQAAVSRREYDVAKAQFDAVLRMEGLAGQPVLEEAKLALANLDSLKEPVPMATTTPATQPSLLEALESASPTTAPAAAGPGSVLGGPVPTTQPP